MKPNTGDARKEEDEAAVGGGTHVHIKALTWLRDSHGLFDYESFQLIKNTLKADKPCILGRCGNEVKILSETECSLAGMSEALVQGRLTKLAAIKCEDGKFFLENCSDGSIYDSQLDKLWLILRHLPNKEVVLRRGDVVKLGRVCFRVRDYRIEDGKEEEEVKNSVCPESSFDLKESVFEQTEGSPEVCRFCHSDEHTPENPLLSICKCTGSLKYVHFKCLKMWINLKRQVKKVSNLWSYYFKTFECEICKTGCPYSVKVDGQLYDLLEVEKPEKGSFVQLETFCKDKNYTRIVHVLQPDAIKSRLKLGRGHDSDVKIGDISVSRVHAQISLTPHGFVLQDNASKFGTLLHLRTPRYELDPANNSVVQASRTTLTFSVKQPEASPAPAGSPLAVPKESDKKAKSESTSEVDSNNVSSDEISKVAAPEAKGADDSSPEVHRDGEPAN